MVGGGGFPFKAETIWGEGGEIPFKADFFFFLLDFINFEKVILDIFRPEIITLVTLGKFVFSGDVTCERRLVEIFIKNMTFRFEG